MPTGPGTSSRVFWAASSLFLFYIGLSDSQTAPREDAHNRRRRGCGYSPNSPANNPGRRLVVLSPAGKSGVCLSIVHCAAFFVYITISYFMPLNLYLATNMISVADTMIVKVHGRPQHARSLTFTCL